MTFNFDTKTKQSKNSIESDPPRLIGTVGELSMTFDISAEAVYQSCGVTFRNEHFIFGGTTPRQVLQVEGCGLVKVGTIPFDLRYGACTATSEVIVLCFDFSVVGDEYKSCQQASSPFGSWTQMVLSMYDHRETSIATSQGKFFNIKGQKLMNAILHNIFTF